jgi:hypothetical protein
MVLEMPKDRVVIGSPPDYGQLIAEVFINDECVAIINREFGDEEMQIELLVEHARKKGVPLDLFISLVERAKSALRDYDRV